MKFFHKICGQKRTDHEEEGSQIEIMKIKRDSDCWRDTGVDKRACYHRGKAGKKGEKSSGSKKPKTKK